jgi:predicted nucleotidyltransferase
MNTEYTYPGTRQHQALLHQIVTYYRDDPRILALTLFGSLARGTWDQYSDLDLDVVIDDHIQLDVLKEVHALCATFTVIGEHAILIAQDKADAADVVLASLREFSIRYHPLATTSPNIVDSVQILTGRIPVEYIRAAGTTNVQPHPAVAPDPMDIFVRLALAVDRELRRQYFWQTLALLDRMRTLVIEMFASAHGGGRAYNVFQAVAPRTLHEKLGATLAQPTLASVQRAVLRLLDIVEQKHTQGELGIAHGLSPAQQTILAKVRQRQQDLHFADVAS